MPTTKTDAIGWMTKGLASFLMANTPGLNQVLEGFPAPNEKLNYPSATIFVKTPVFTPLYSYVIAKGPVDPVTNKAVIAKVRGMYDFELQLDVWTAYKPQRGAMVDAIQMAFNTDPDVSGINLQLPDYFGESVALSISQVQYMDSAEAESQRGEWRALITVVGNMRLVQEQTSALMQTIENTVETPEQIDDPDAGSGQGLALL